MKISRFLPRSIIVAALACWSSGIAAAQATEIHMKIDSANSIVETSGGFFGAGMGDLQVYGVIGMTIDGSSIRFTDISLSTEPSGYDWFFPEFPGYLNQDGTFVGAHPSQLDHTFNGRVEGETLYLNGLLTEQWPDGYQYLFTIRATRTNLDVPVIGRWGLICLIVCIAGAGMLALKRSM